LWWLVEVLAVVIMQAVVVQGVIALAQLNLLLSERLTP
jgi:hypothetical protein